MVAAAQQLYARNWKPDNTPSIEEWRQLFLKYTELDKLTKKLNARLNKEYTQDWEKVKIYFKILKLYKLCQKN